MNTCTTIGHEEDEADAAGLDGRALGDQLRHLDRQLRAVEARIAATISAAEQGGAFGDTSHAARCASLTETGDEMILRATCDQATGAALKEIFDRFTDHEWRTDWNECQRDACGPPHDHKPTTAPNTNTAAPPTSTTATPAAPNTTATNPRTTSPSPATNTATSTTTDPTAPKSAEPQGPDTSARPW